MSPTEANLVTRDLVAQDYKAATAQYELIRSDCLEMAQLKSNFDIEQFTLNSQGPFPAHQFHFLMRQYSLALIELRRLYNDYNRLVKRKGWLECGEVIDDPREGFFAKNEAIECGLQMDSLMLSIVNKRKMCERFELCRKELVARNGGNFTNAQYQAEEPAYWEHVFTQMISNYRLQAKSGIPEGVWKNLQAAQSEPLLAEGNRLEFKQVQALPAPEEQHDIWEQW